jgi:DNA (cytosine-5)-methyltransferase 1
VEKTGCHTSVDLFSGAGGMTYCFKLAGIEAKISNDFAESACVTLKTNSPEIDVFCGDITKDETKQRIISAGVSAGADIICGGPPCQGFSLAGFRMANDPRNELFRHFVDIVSGVNPKIIVFENVEGILSYQGGETYRNIIQLFSELGYNCEGRKLLAHQYGVPQKRKRVIILCVRKDLEVLPKDLYPDFITPNDDRQITAYDTIADLENIECSTGVQYIQVHTSPLIKFFKKEISVSDYLSTVKDERGIVSESIDDLDDDNEESDLEAELARPQNTQKSKAKKSTADEQQLSLFDI